MALADYITANFLSIKTQLGWSDSLQIDAITEKTLEYYGVDTEAEATDSKKLHALADVAVWRQASNDVALDYSFQADGASYSRGQMHDHIRKSLDGAESAAIVYMPNYAITYNATDDHPDWTE